MKKHLLLVLPPRQFGVFFLTLVFCIYTLIIANKKTLSNKGCGKGGEGNRTWIPLIAYFAIRGLSSLPTSSDHILIRASVRGVR